MKNIIYMVVYLTFLPLLLNSQNKFNNEGVRVILEYKNYYFCDTYREAIFIKIKNETNKKIYIVSQYSFYSYLQVIHKVFEDEYVDFIKDKNTNLKHLNCVKCNQYLEENNVTFENYYNDFLSKINNSNHFSLNQKQFDSIYFKYNKKTDGSNNFIILFLDKGEEYQFVNFIDGTQENSQEYLKGDTVKLIYNFPNILGSPSKFIPKFPKTIQGYYKWKQDIKSDTLSIKLK